MWSFIVVNSETLYYITRNKYESLNRTLKKQNKKEKFAISEI